MDFELWWLLSWPAFFILGWLAARIDIKHVVRESSALPRSTLMGLNFLLNEQQDKAIDSFLEAIAVDPQTIELYFALGNLFRRRGEFDRAIRVHQSLVEREDITEAQRVQALSELGQDFFKAGLLDRAEEVYTRLRETDRRPEALRALLEVYQQEKDWAKAVETARMLPDQNNAMWEREISNFYCELASNDIANSRFEQAVEQVENALKISRRCVRALVLQGDIFAAKGQDQAALESWQRIEQQNPEYLSLVALKMTEAFGRLNQAEKGIQLLRSYLEKYPSIDLLEAVFKWEMEQHGAEAAYAVVRNELRRNPTLLGLDKLLEAVGQTISPDKRPDLEMVKGMIHAHTRRVARYFCSDCGFKARQFYWHCPACGGWETYPPKRTEEFDLSP